MISYIFFVFLLTLAVLCSILISIADFRHRIIPDVYLFPLMLCGLTLTTFYTFPIPVTDAVIGAIFGYIMSITIGFIFDNFLRKRNPNSETPIGMGDIKLLGVGGIWLGITGMSVALVFACVTGVIWASINKQKFIPFAPFFLFGGFLSFIVNLFLI